MMDGIIKADGTSRLMRATLPATYEEFKAQAAAGTLPLDVLFNSDGWSQMPTFLNKANLLKDATAALFGLGANAVPDDVFAFLGKYAQYWWRRRQPTMVYTTTESPSTKQVYIIYNPGSTSATRPINYSDSISVDQSTGTISLVNPQTVDVSYSNRGTTVDGILAGKYVTNLYTDPSTVYKFATTPAYSRDTSRYSLYFVSGNVTVVSSVGTQGYTDWEYLQSNNRNAYPDSGESGGYEYEYIGVPFEKLPVASSVEIGSYVGTGTYGEANPNSLTFNCIPKIVYITAGGNGGMFLINDGNTVSYVGTGTHTIGYMVHCTFDGKSISWYTNDTDNAAYGPQSQGNASNVTYRYIVFG